MNKTANSILRGLEQSIRYAKDRVPKRTYRLHVPAHIHIGVKAIRRSKREPK